MNTAHAALSNLGVPTVLEGEPLSLPDRIEWLRLTSPMPVQPAQRPRFVPPADREVPSLREEAMRILAEAGVELPPGQPLSFTTLDEMGLLPRPPVAPREMDGAADRGPAVELDVDSPDVSAPTKSALPEVDIG